MASTVLASAGSSPDTVLNASSSGSSPRNSALAWSISPTTTPGPSDALPSSGTIRPSIAASSVDLPEPFAPVIATRSAQSICRSTGPRVNAPRRTTAPRSTATTAPARGAAATCMRSSHSRRGSSTASSRSIIRSVCLALAACFWLDSTRYARMLRSGSDARFRRTLRTPLSAQARCARARASRPAFVSAYSSYSRRACRRCVSRSAR